MQEPAHETSQHSEDENPFREYELVNDPQRLRELVANTFREVLAQDVSIALGSAELAASDHPRFASKTKENAGEAHRALQVTTGHMQQLEKILRKPHNQIPIDTRYRGETNDRSKDFISLPNDTKDNQPLSKTAPIPTLAKS